MQFGATNNYRTDQAFFDCSTHRNKRLDGCKGHFIREAVLDRIILSHIQAVTNCILYHEDYFRKTMSELRQMQSEEELLALRKQLERSEKRIAELKRLFMRVYEDNTVGRLSDERYEMLSASYEAEQKQLEAEADRIQKEIEVQEKQTESVEQFIARLKDHSLEIDTLDGYVLHELIEAIYVEAPDKSSGHRVQRIHIKYNGIGFIPINELMAKRTA